MTQDQENIIKRYYRGETSPEEERKLKTAFRAGLFPNDPILAYRKEETPLPETVRKRILEQIHERKIRPLHRIWLATSGIAALLILIFTFRSLLPPKAGLLRLSDNMKKERFENALKVLENALKEPSAPTQKVLYEDNKLIIAVE